MYTVSVQAYNAKTDLISTSEARKATPLRAPFSMVVNPAALTIQGGASATATLSVTSQVNPYPGLIFLDVADVPDGMDVTLSTDIVTPTVQGAQVALRIEPSTTLPGGVYRVKVEAFSDGDTRTITIPVTVQEPGFTPRTSKQSLVLTSGRSVSVDIDATYQFGENDPIDVELLGIPAGVDWAFTSQRFLPGGKATLVLSGTDDLTLGDYKVVLEASDHTHAHEFSLPLTIAGISLDVNGDSRAVLNEETAIFPVQLKGKAWTKPVSLSFDPASVDDQFLTTISRATTNAPASLTVRSHTPGGYTTRYLYTAAPGNQRWAHHNATPVCHRTGRSSGNRPSDGLRSVW